MTLIVHTQEDEQRQLNMTIEVPEERVNDQINKKIRQLARQVNFPGFRKGKVPTHVIVKQFGADYLRAEAVEDMVNDLFSEALRQTQVTPYAQPVLHNLELHPVVLKLTIPLEPQVTLADYRATFREEISEPEITEEQVNEALVRLQQSHKTVNVVDRPAAAGDLVVVSGSIVLEPTGEEGERATDNVLVDGENEEFVLDPAETYPGTNFVEQLIGAVAGDVKAFSFDFPADDEDYPGRKGLTSFTVNEVKEVILPELNDEFAKVVDEEYETLEQVREAEKERLLREAQQEARGALLDKFVEELLGQSTLIYPPGAVTQELQDMTDNLRQQVENYGWKWEDYLNNSGKTVEDLHEGWRERAVKQLERGLILRELIRSEKIFVTNEEIEAEFNSQMDQMNRDMTAEIREMMRNIIFSQQEGRMRLANDVMLGKVHDRLKQIYSGTAPDLNDVEVDHSAFDFDHDHEHDHDHDHA